MRPFNEIIGAGGQEKFEGVGNYIRLKTGVVPITFKTENNEEVTLEQGDSVNLEKFDYLLISHDDAADQDITYYIGFDTSMAGSKIAGSVQITGGSDNTASPPSVDINNTPYIQGVLDPQTQQTLEAHWGALVGTALITIVAPSTNLNGIRIDNINMADVVTTGHCNVLAKTSAPTSWNDTVARTLANFYVSTNMDHDKINKIILPAGEGLYAQANVDGVCRLSIDYKVL